MALSTRHPLYSSFVEEWRDIQDTYDGETRVKAQGFVHLPATSGMIADGAMASLESDGWKQYDAYRKRAYVPELVRMAIDEIVGVMHRKPPTIELPPAMEPMIQRATRRNESLAMLLQAINRAQFLKGRIGLLLDAPTVTGAKRKPMPYISTYAAETIGNWDEGRRDDPDLPGAVLNLVVLDESENERQEKFEWKHQTKYRVCVLGDTTKNDAKGVYRVGTFREEEFSESGLIAPTIDGRTLDEVPFVFINSRDIVSDPDRSPSIPLARLVLAIYRLEADYRQALFQQGQDTLVTIGATGTDGKHKTGANASIDLPIGGDAKYIGVNGKGLPEMRAALENDYKRAAEAAGKLLDTTSREKESGDALRTRVAARMASPQQIAIVGAFGLEQCLKIAARWMGADDTKVRVVPNLDFSDDEMQGKNLLDLMSSKTQGAPISMESIHDLCRERGLTKRTFEEEIAKIEEEQAMAAFRQPESNSPEDPNAGDGGQGGRAGGRGGRTSGQ